MFVELPTSRLYATKFVDPAGAGLVDAYSAKNDPFGSVTVPAAGNPGRREIVIVITEPVGIKTPPFVNSAEDPMTTVEPTCKNEPDSLDELIVNPGELAVA